ncbi:MAG: hypothetical protein KU28_00425 [Sulfurovum sp. PC08-66]|nr:MAG: hypothetical protein KU28_00425 [Sulfurovum sp. PC08-66]KIM12435.1 MAG: hypothetical protein KU37_00545 [Sulfuricurvum sp. PC08-66]
MIQNRIFFALFIFLIGIIEWLATTTVHIEVVEHFWDKLNHFAAFATLFVVGRGAFGVLSMVLAVALLGFGLQIEVVQHFIEGRYFSMLDVVADTVGIAIGWAFALGVRKVLRTR